MSDQVQDEIPAPRRDPLAEGDPAFMEQFDALYIQHVWGDGAVPAKYKEWAGVALSIIGRCEPCLAYHLRMSVQAGMSKAELVEAIRLGIMSGGSITIPTARYAYSVMEELLGR